MAVRQRIEKVYKGVLSGQVTELYHTPVTKKQLKGLFIIADGEVNVKMYNGYDIIFSFTGTPTADKIASMQDKIHSLNYPARGNNFKFILEPSGLTPGTQISVYAATE